MNIFVYGTLKNGHPRNFYLIQGKAKFIGEAKTKPHYMLYKSWFDDWPCMVEVKDGISVEGEVWEVNDDMLRTLDFLENVPSLFQRKTIELMDGTKADAYLTTKPALAWKVGPKWDKK